MYMCTLLCIYVRTLIRGDLYIQVSIEIYELGVDCCLHAIKAVSLVAAPRLSKDAAMIRRQGTRTAIRKKKN